MHQCHKTNLNWPSLKKKKSIFESFQFAKVCVYFWFHSASLCMLAIELFLLSYPVKTGRHWNYNFTILTLQLQNIGSVWNHAFVLINIKILTNSAVIFTSILYSVSAACVCWKSYRNRSSRFCVILLPDNQTPPKTLPWLTEVISNTQCRSEAAWSVSGHHQNHWSASSENHECQTKAQLCLHSIRKRYLMEYVFKKGLWLQAIQFFH